MSQPRSPVLTAWSAPRAHSQRGKGAFYLGVGVLVMFMSPNTSFFGINNVAAIVLAIVGFLHA